MNYDKIIQGIMDIGESLLCTGAEIYRVQDSIDRMCTSYGFLRQDVFVIQNNIQITVETKEHEMITQIRHVETTGFNYDRLDALNGLSRYICTNRPDDEELQKRYREIMDAPTQKAWIIVLAQIVGGVHRVLWKMAGEAGRKSPDLQSDTFFSVRSICCSGIPGRNYGASGLDHDWCCNAAC